jgi:hypothetical protein
MKLANFQANQLIFLDESCIHSKLSERTHGWGPKGDAVRAKVTSKQADNLSLLPAMTMDGYIACNVYKGAVNAELFEAFISEDLLPKCGRFPGPRSIIVMDNARIHGSDDDEDASISFF